MKMQNVQSELFHPSRQGWKFLNRNNFEDWIHPTCFYRLKNNLNIFEGTLFFSELVAYLQVTQAKHV